MLYVKAGVMDEVGRVQAHLDCFLKVLAWCVCLTQKLLTYLQQVYIMPV